MTRTNPIENAGKTSEESREYSFLTTGRVTTAPTGQSDGAHHAVVQESSAPSDRPLPVLPSVHGDYYVPPKNAPVVVAPMGRNDYAIVSGAVPNIDKKSIEPGERILSHPTSKATVRFGNDGTIDIHGDTTVRINNGTQGAITDVTTTKDADGHVTSISLERNNSILL